MAWAGFFIASVLCLGVSILTALFINRYLRKKAKKPFKVTVILGVGVVVAATLLFIPIYKSALNEDPCGSLEVFLIAVHNMIRLFVVDGEFSFITQNLHGSSVLVAKLYSVYFSVLFVFAPILTFGFIASFFKNFLEHLRYYYHYNADVFVFSHLNESSLALASDLNEKNDKRVFLFTNISVEEYEKDSDLMAKINRIHAICFKEDITAANLFFHNKKKCLTFLTIGEDQGENVKKALEITGKYRSRENTQVYVFATQVEAEIILSSAINTYKKLAEEQGEPFNIKIRRVNEVQSLILRNLYEKGYKKIFCSAIDDGSGVKKINAIVVGLGQHGTEMVKALAWFCQMDGYLVDINVFDLDPEAENKFRSLCPELMEFSGKLDVDGEAKYTINIHSGINIASAEFDRMIAGLPQTTYAFVSLGDDERNIETAVKLRVMFERLKYEPEIQTIVYNSDKKKSLKDVENFKGQKYNIDFIGDMQSSFSESTVFASDLAEEALARHRSYGADEESFWQYDYNYKSSVASVIHKQMKRLCGIPGIDKPKDQRTESELWGIRRLEHNRWNAYMRSEGYIYGGTVEKSGRNDLGKMHNCLVPFDKLPLAEQEKDDD